MYLNKRNNVRLKIKSTLTAGWNLLILENHKLLWDDFADDVTKEFNLTLVKYSWTSPIQMEIVRVKSKSWDKFIIDRAIEACPLNYNASENTQNSLEFSIWDFAIQTLTASEINSLSGEIIELQNNKLNKNDSDITKQGNNFNSWNQLLKLDWDWRVPEGNLPPMNININWLPKIDFKANMSLIAYDNETQKNYKFPTNHISERFETIERDMASKTDMVFFDITNQSAPNISDGQDINISHNLGVKPSVMYIYTNVVHWIWTNWKQMWWFLTNRWAVYKNLLYEINNPRRLHLMRVSEVTDNNIKLYIESRQSDIDAVKWTIWILLIK